VPYFKYVLKLFKETLLLLVRVLAVYTFCEINLFKNGLAESWLSQSEGVMTWRGIFRVEDQAVEDRDPPSGGL
jgi:hypothetical protein